MPSIKKISFFTASLGFGGTERVVSLLCNELSTYYDVTLILIYNRIDFEISNNVKLIILTDLNIESKTSILKKTYNFYLFLNEYRKTLKNNNIDLAFSFLGRQNIINSIIKILYPKIKTVISERCFPTLMYGNNKLRLFFIKNIYSFLYSKNNALFSNSIYINKDLKDNFKVKIESAVIYNPLKESIFNKSFLKYDNNSFNIISVGRLTPIKNYEGIIKTMTLLSNKYHLNIFGNGPLHSKINNSIKKLNLVNKITLKGVDSNIQNRLVEHHCLVLNSHSEGFPNVILEAMAVGLPVISTNCMSGPLELLNDNDPAEIPLESFFMAKYGLLVNVDDPVGLSKAIEYLQENEDLRKKYSDLAFEKAKTFGIENISLKMRNLIDTLL